MYDTLKCLHVRTRLSCPDVNAVVVNRKNVGHDHDVENLRGEEL